MHFATVGTRPPDFEEPPTLVHGCIEQRAIWTSTALNDYLDFPGTGQAFMLRRIGHHKATGNTSTEVVYGLSSHTSESANPQRLLTLNREHWCIENSAHHCLDWSFDEDRRRIRTGYRPENTTRLRRFAIEEKARVGCARVCGPGSALAKWPGTTACPPHDSARLHVMGSGE